MTHGSWLNLMPRKRQSIGLAKSSELVRMLVKIPMTVQESPLYLNKPKIIIRRILKMAMVSLGICVGSKARGKKIGVTAYWTSWRFWIREKISLSKAKL